MRSWVLACLVFGLWGHSAVSGEELFNGRDLSGWEGDTAHWRVEDGAIIGAEVAEGKNTR